MSECQSLVEHYVAHDSVIQHVKELLTAVNHNRRNFEILMKKWGKVLALNLSGIKNPCIYLPLPCLINPYRITF